MQRMERKRKDEEKTFAVEREKERETRRVRERAEETFIRKQIHIYKMFTSSIHVGRQGATAARDLLRHRTGKYVS